MINPFRPDFADTPIAPTRPSLALDVPRLGGTGGTSAVPIVSLVTVAAANDSRDTIARSRAALERRTLGEVEWIVIDGDGAASWNQGVRQARAPLVLLLEAGDMPEPGAIEKLAWFMHANLRFEFADGFGVRLGAAPGLETGGFHHARAMATMVPRGPGGVMIRASAWRAVNGLDESMPVASSWWDFIARLASSGRWGATLPEFLWWHGRDVVRPTRPPASARALLSGPVPPYTPVTPLESPGLRPFANPLKTTKPRVIIVAPWLTMGGADKFNLDLVEQMTKRGWGVTFVTTFPGDHTWLTRLVRMTNDFFMLGPLLRDAQHATFLRALVESRSAQAMVITGSETGYASLPYLREHCPGLAIVDVNHIEEITWRAGGHPATGARLKPLLDANVVVSAHLALWMAARASTVDHIEVCTINVDADHWRPDAKVRAARRRALAIDESDVLITFAGRICAQKRPRMLAAVLGELARRRSTGWIAAIAGGGPEDASLDIALATDGAADRTRRLGVLDPEEVRDLLAASDLLFLPSAWEGIALVAYEAMACGVPVVGSDVGGQRELITPDCGDLVPLGDGGPGEVSLLADAIERMITDPSRRLAMGIASRRRIEDHFTLDRMGERFISILDDAKRTAVSRAPLAPFTGASWTATEIEYVRLARHAEAFDAPMTPASSASVTPTGGLRRWLRDLMQPTSAV